MGNKLYVGNLAYSVRDDDLQQAFAQFGTVASAKVMMDRDTGRSKGFGFVEMGSDAEAQSAINGMNGQALDGRALVVNEARPREERPGGFGGGGGGRPGGGGRDGGGGRRGPGGGGRGGAPAGGRGARPRPGRAWERGGGKGRGLWRPPPFFLLHAGALLARAAFARATRQHGVEQRIRQQPQQLRHHAHLPWDDAKAGAGFDRVVRLVGEALG